MGFTSIICGPSTPSGWCSRNWDGARKSFPFFFAALAASTVVAGLSFRFIERPLLGLKARFASDPGAPGHDARPTSQRVESAAI